MFFVAVTNQTLAWGDQDSNQKQVNVAILNDELPEASEQFQVRLSSPSTGVSIGSPSVLTVTIQDNDEQSAPGTLRFTNAAETVGEGAGSLPIYAERIGGSAGQISVGVSTQALDATSGADFVAVTNETLTWDDQDSSPKQVNVPILNDNLHETNERFQVKLISPSTGVSIGSPGVLTVTIEDDDTDEDSGKLLFPSFSTGNSSSFTGLAVTNYSLAPARLRFEAFDSYGNRITDQTGSADLTLEPRSQLAKLVSEVFPGIPAFGIQRGWISVTSDNPAVGAFFLIGNGKPSRLDGSVAFRSQSQKLYFTRIYHQENGSGGGSIERYAAYARLYIANPNPEEITIALRYHPPSGQALSGTSSSMAAVTKTVPALGVLPFEVDDVVDPVEFPGMRGGYITATVTEGLGVIGFEELSFPGRDVLITLNAHSEETATELYSAQLASVPGSLFTSIRLINTSEEARTVTLEAIANDGSTLSLHPTSLVLNPGDSVEQDARELLALPDGEAVGSLRVQVDGPGVLGDVVFGDAKKLDYAAALPLQGTLFTEAVFSHVANAKGYFTGIALYNPQNRATKVRVRVYTKEGQLKGDVPRSLAPGARESVLLTEWLPFTEGQVGGFVIVTSTEPIAGQQLFGTTDLSVLAAIPPTIVSVETD